MIQKTNFISPNFCGCIVEISREFKVSDSVKDKVLQTMNGNQVLADIMVKELQTRGQFDEVSETYEILNQCDTHSLYPDADSLYAEIKNFHGWAKTLDACGCTISLWRDDRLPETEINPIEHPVHTKRCPLHQAKDPAEHYAEVEAFAVADALTKAESLS